MQDVIIVACVLLVILAASFLVTWLLYRKKEIKEILYKGADNSFWTIFALAFIIILWILSKF